MQVTRKEGAQNKTRRTITEREFVGRAWVNTTQDGRKWLRVTIDQDIESLTVNSENQEFQLWPNTKREGKQDADYRLSLCKVEVQGEGEEGTSAVEAEATQQQASV